MGDFSENEMVCEVELCGKLLEESFQSVAVNELQTECED